MLPIRGSAATVPQGCTRSDRESRETNLAWIRRQYDELNSTRKDPATYVLLVGGTNMYDFRLRVAQSQLRHDLTMSYWSHAALFADVVPDIGESLLLETSLEPSDGFQLPTRYNGIQGAQLSRYKSRALYPNLALIRVPVEPSKWRTGVDDQKSILDQFAEQRVVVDAPRLILEWLAFVWGAGTDGNPLLRGYGIPSAAVIEALIGAAGYDLCPGQDSSASSPEAFWQTAKWWQKYYDGIKVPGTETRYTVIEERRRQAPSSATKPDLTAGLFAEPAE